MADIDFSLVLTEARNRNWDDRTLAQRAADLAQELLPASLKMLKSEERPLLAALSSLASDETARRFLTRLDHEVLHARDAATQADALRTIIRELGGIPTFFSTPDRFRLKAAAMASHGVLSSALNTDIRRIVRNTFGGLVVPTRLDRVKRCLDNLSKDGVKPVLALLSPEVFGPKSASTYAKRLEETVNNCEGVGLSVQPWRLCPHLHPAAPTVGARELAEKLRAVLRLCTKGVNSRPLIIEAATADTMAIVVEALKSTLSGTEFNHSNVALEIPAYQRGGIALLRDLADWAKARCDKGGDPLKVLLTKGSRLNEEAPMAFLYGGEHAVSTSKGETETRFKQLIHAVIQAKGLMPIVGTHNVFDIAYTMLDWERGKRDGSPMFAMQMGMGNHTARLMAQTGSTVWMTAPVAAEDGPAAAAFEIFLLRTMHDLARPDGFLSAGYAVDSASPAWSRMRQQFLASLSGREETPQEGAAPESFTPCTLGHLLDRSHIDAVYAAAAAEMERPQELIPLTLGGKNIASPLHCIHRSLTIPGQADYRFISADYPAIDAVLQQAAKAAAQIPPTMGERMAVLENITRELVKQRTEMIALLVRDAGFTVADAELELRDATDACRYYAHMAEQDGTTDGTQAAPLGVVVVAPSLPHPLTDAVAGIAAAWVTGNTIVYKPAAYTTLLGSRLTALLAKAGLKEPSLFCLPALDNQISLRLMTDSRVGGVIHPAEPENAKHIAANTTANIMSQPCGMATVFISEHGEWEQCVRDVAAAAFKRSGQSPDCPHLLLAQAPVCDNPRFIAALKDAVSMLKADPGHREGTNVGPLSYLLEDECWHMLTDADDDETWLVQPMTREKGSLIWTPGIRTGVKPGSRFLKHASRLPLLGLVRVADADEAATLQRLYSAGLSAAIYSTDTEEISRWRHTVRCASVCINCCPQARPGIRPFGCRIPSLRGTAPLPGGPNFLLNLNRWIESGRPQRRGKQRNTAFSPWEVLPVSPEDKTRLTSAADSLAYWWEELFSKTQPISREPDATTDLRYHPVHVCMRAEADMDDADIAIAVMAALKTGSRLQISLPQERPWMAALASLPTISVHPEDRAEYELRFADLSKAGFHLRDTTPTQSTLEQASAHSLALDTAPVLANGRLELLHFLREIVTTTAVRAH